MVIILIILIIITTIIVYIGANLLRAIIDGGVAHRETITRYTVLDENYDEFMARSLVSEASRLALRTSGGKIGTARFKVINS